MIARQRDDPDDGRWWHHRRFKSTIILLWFVSFAFILPTSSTNTRISHKTAIILVWRSNSLFTIFKTIFSVRSNQMTAAEKQAICSFSSLIWSWTQWFYHVRSHRCWCCWDAVASLRKSHRTSLRRRRLRRCDGGEHRHSWCHAVIYSNSVCVRSEDKLWAWRKHIFLSSIWHILATFFLVFLLKIHFKPRLLHYLFLWNYVIARVDGLVRSWQLH